MHCIYSNVFLCICIYIFVCKYLQVNSCSLSFTTADAAVHFRNPLKVRGFGDCSVAGFSLPLNTFIWVPVGAYYITLSYLNYNFYVCTNHTCMYKYLHVFI